jgi:A/G-specific adenine glycosylase
MNSKFQTRLLAWYRAHSRAMPWRGTRDPYRIWLSEVMLQQTRVAAVVGYYRRFLRRFPTVQALARAPQSAVLKHWAGLGYYTRARNLHRAAKEVVAKHNGRFPRTLDAALALPGVGGYTAAAVLSIAHDQPHAVLDGNVARVLARLFAIRGDLRRPQRWRQLQSLANGLLRKHGAQAESLRYSPGDWNQAMMELGATVCTPRAPRCRACPVARWCRAQQLGIADQLPAARRKPATQQVHIAAAVLLDPRGRTLLLPPNGASHDGLFSRLWQFPAVQGARATGKRLALQLSSRKGGALTQGTQRGTEDAENGQPQIALKPTRHTVTHRALALQPYLMRVTELPRIRGARTPRLDRLDSLPVSSATRKIARRALEHLAASKVKQRSATA